MSTSYHRISDETRYSHIYQAPQENILTHNLWHEWISSEILIQTGVSGQEKAQKETEPFNNSTVYLKSLCCIRKNSKSQAVSPQTSIFNHTQKSPQNSSVKTEKTHTVFQDEKCRMLNAIVFPCQKNWGNTISDYNQPLWSLYSHQGSEKTEFPDLH